METRSKSKEKLQQKNVETTEDKEENSPLRRKEDLIVLLNALFKYGHSNLPSCILPNMSKEERHSVIQLTFEEAKIAIRRKSSIIEWLNTDIFGTDGYDTSLALLLIGLYEQYTLSEQGNQECDFREIYLFLYKMMTNQTAPCLSHNSAKVLHKLLSELIDDVWPSMQSELLKYLSDIHIYTRPEVRRTYSAKQILKRKAAKNDAF